MSLAQAIEVITQLTRKDREVLITVMQVLDKKKEPSTRKRWTKEDDKILLDLAAQRNGFARAGKKLGRTIAACRTRFNTLGYTVAE